MQATKETELLKVSVFNKFNGKSDDLTKKTTKNNEKNGGSFGFDIAWNEI